MSGPFSITETGLTIAIRLTPKGGRDSLGAVETLSDGQAVLKARVRAAPQDGAANDALIRLVARACDVAPRDVSLVAGATARVKRVAVRGDGAALAGKLNTMTEKA
ncbi:MAG: DUF167 family protein [Pseudorhodoplanes sp.]